MIMEENMTLSADESDIRDLKRAIATNIDIVRATLPERVRLLAVSKQVSTELIRQAYAAGIRDFGESKIQEMERKHSELADLTDIRWHLIGHLQSNKVRKAVALFDWIHSVDTLKLACQIDRVASELDRRPHICLQVKLLPDPDKYGWELDRLRTELGELKSLSHINLCGLTVIAPLGLTPSATKALFTHAHNLAEELALTELSMGMSDDYPIAIECGSTIVRLGSILFKIRINV
jgi:PLP dependent protein